jgi:predicted aldo/keto reductase-like oxidoreductase
MPCPSGVGIPRVFDIYNEGRVYGLQNDARKKYERWAATQANSKVATACVECGKCEELCPQHIPIMAQLKEAHDYLTQGC